MFRNFEKFTNLIILEANNGFFERTEKKCSRRNKSIDEKTKFELKYTFLNFGKFF
jgi:hypothetical protein